MQLNFHVSANVSPYDSVSCCLSRARDIPVAILFDCVRHAAVDILVAGRNIILVHNEENAHLKQFLDPLVAGLHPKMLARFTLDIIVTARNGMHFCELLAVPVTGL